MNHVGPPPFQNGGSSGDPLLFVLLGVLMAVSAVSLAYLWMFRRRQKSQGDGGEEAMEKTRIDRMGLSRRAEEVLEKLMESSRMQNELPGELDVSKATVSNAVGELFDRNLIKKKKKGNTYLLEPRKEKIEDQSR